MTTTIRIAGPPGTGKTTKLVKIYYESLKNYDPVDIVVISHTNTAANHIRSKIFSNESIGEYMKETEHEVFGTIKDAKETLKKNVVTIHKFCKDRVKGESFQIEDYEILCNLHSEFNDHASNKEYYNVELLFKKHPFFKFMGFARDNGKNFQDYYRSLTQEEKKKYKYSKDQLPDMERKYNSFKTNEKINGRAKVILDFQDMVEKFCDDSEVSDSVCKDIKVLIVDEAQDSSVIQRKAKKVMSKNVDYFYKAGDPDQTIFEFAGADPDSFHKEFANPEIELKEGYRCPRVVNEYCKNIIKPIWDHYRYSRVWKPRQTKDGQIVEGELFEMSSLTQDPFAPELKNRILNTNQNFIFTYRGNEPTLMIEYLVELGMPIKIPTDAKLKYKYPSVAIKNHRQFLHLLNGDKLSSGKIRSILKDTDPQYTINNSTDSLELSYDLNWLIKEKYFVPGVKDITDFQEIRKNKSSIEANYIRKIINNNRDLVEKDRIFLENIHTIKGKEFHNVVLDLTLTRDEEDFAKRRMKFVACSRASETLWTIKSRNGYTL